MEEEKTKKKMKKSDEIKELQDEVLRAKADLINYRKRKDEEVSNLLKYANSDLILSLLPVVDNFERAIALDDSNLTDELSNFLVGFKMIYANFKEILEANNIKEIMCFKEKFDSKMHNCVLTDNDPNYEDGIITEVLLKGYTYNDKILRCPSVKVNKIEKEKNTQESERNDENE